MLCAWKVAFLKSSHICANFKMTVNPQLHPKTYPLPTLDEVFAVLAQGESFSTIDLSRAYKQMEVAEGSRPFLTINTHMGLFRYRRLPFGIATAPAMGQRAMCIVLQGCRGVVYYIDDILVTGRSWKEHEENLQEVFRHLQQFGLKIKLEKCRFFEESVDYLGAYNILSRTSSHQGENCKHCAGTSTKQ